MNFEASTPRNHSRRGRRARSDAPVTRVLAMLIAGVLAAGCSFLRPAPDNSRYFALSSTDSLPAAAPERRRPDLHLGLGPIRLPGYLDAQAIVRSGSSGSLDYIPDAFWAEPLSKGFARALLYRTEARAGTTHGVAYPWYSTTRVDVRVPVDVLRFEATSDDRVVLVARWSVERTGDGKIIAGDHSVFEESVTSDPAVIVDALSRCLDRLAEAIAVGVTGAAPSSAPADPAGAE